MLLINLYWSHFRLTRNSNPFKYNHLMILLYTYVYLFVVTTNIISNFEVIIQYLYLLSTSTVYAVKEMAKKPRDKKRKRRNDCSWVGNLSSMDLSFKGNFRLMKEFKQCSFLLFSNFAHRNLVKIS